MRAVIFLFFILNLNCWMKCIEKKTPPWFFSFRTSQWMWGRWQTTPRRSVLLGSDWYADKGGAGRGADTERTGQRRSCTHVVVEPDAFLIVPLLGSFSFFNTRGFQTCAWGSTRKHHNTCTWVSLFFRLLWLLYSVVNCAEYPLYICTKCYFSHVAIK